MTDTILEQIIYIRDLGITNMFDIATVQQIAVELNFNELARYIQENRNKYFNFILYGKEAK